LGGTSSDLGWPAKIGSFAIGIILVILIGVLFHLARSDSRPWTATQLREFYEDLESRPDLHGPLYYLGSDDRFHYFTIRSVDVSLWPRVPKDQIPLDALPFLGPREKTYYEVDPSHGFRKVALVP
jgi:hypothetical protein